MQVTPAPPPSTKGIVCRSYCATTAQPIEIRSEPAHQSCLQNLSLFAPPSILVLCGLRLLSPQHPPPSYHHRHHHSQCLDRPCVSLPALPGFSLLAESSRYVSSSRIPHPASIQFSLEKVTTYMAQLRPDSVQKISRLFRLLRDLLIFHFSTIRHDMSLLPYSPARSVPMPGISQPQQRSHPSLSRGSEVLLRKLDWLRPEGFSLSGRIII